MSYGGIEEVEIDNDYGLFYVKRDGGYWNKYKIAEESNFLDWILSHKEDESGGDIPIYELGASEEEYEEEVIYDDFENSRDYNNDDGWGW